MFGCLRGCGADPGVSYADGVAEEEKRGRLATRGVGKDIVRL
jgi:hypothetical protein